MRINKMAAGPAVAVLILGTVPILTAPVATAVPCGTPGSPATRTQACHDCIRAHNYQGTACFDMAIQTPAAPPRTAPPQTRAPVQTPTAPPTYAPPSTVPVQTPQFSPPPAPTTVPVQTPKINPPSSGAPKNAPVVAPPKGLDAPPEAVAAAKSAPEIRVDPANPPKPPVQGDVNRQVQSVLANHGNNVDVVKAGNQELTRPRHWGFVDYDAYHRPTLYNPLKEGTTFRYFYNGAFREVHVPAGGRIVLDIATAALFPFTAVSDSYVASGSFYGGGWTPPQDWNGPPPPDYSPPVPPTVYSDVTAYVPAANTTVQVGKVTVVGHDEGQPAGGQDIFMLDDNTLAWGQVSGPGNGAQINVVKTQSLPGVGPTDNGALLVALAAHERPTSQPWWLWVVGGGAVAIAAGLITAVILRRRRPGEVREQVDVTAPISIAPERPHAVTETAASETEIADEHPAGDRPPGFTEPPGE
jgi:hypothetical protein